MKKTKFVVAFALGLVMAAIPRDVAASSTSTIYSFGTITPDGADPKGSLTYLNGLLFGRTTTTTKHGSGDGVIFHFDPNNVGSTYTIDHMFTGNPDGDNPRHDAMTPFNGLLYGTTLEGGTHNNGIIFSIGQDGTGYQELLSLHSSIGDESHSCFVIVNNILYGMTASGGDDDEGVIFSFDPTAPTPTPTATPTPTPDEFPHLILFHVYVGGQRAAWAPDAGSQWDYLVWDDAQGRRSRIWRGVQHRHERQQLHCLTRF